MAERVCQFFLRGRCQRQKCEFRHPADQAGPRGPIAVAERSGGANKDTHCKFFLSTGCKFGTSCHFRHVGRERRRSRSRERRSRSRSFDREERRRGVWEGPRVGMSLTEERSWRERLMARRKIRLRHMRTRSRSPSRSPNPPPTAPLRRPARILRASTSPLNKKDDIQTPTDAKKDDLKDVGADSTKTEAGSSKAKDGVKSQQKRCDKCGQKIK